MAFKYTWNKKEANFGPPIKSEVVGGTHFASECFLKFKDKYVALRRPLAVPEHEVPQKAQKLNSPCLYNVHGLPRWGESLQKYLERIIKAQTGVGIKSFKLADLSMGVYKKTKQWYIEPAFI